MCKLWGWWFDRVVGTRVSMRLRGNYLSYLMVGYTDIVCGKSHVEFTFMVI